MSEIGSLDERATGDFVVNKVPEYSVLNTDTEKESDENFSKLLIKIIKNAPLFETEQHGTFTRLYVPEEQKRSPALAIKLLLSPESRRREEVLDFWNSLSLADKNKTLRDKSRFRIDGKSEPHLDELSDDEKMALVLAYEDTLHQELYPGFVAPSIFLVFTAENDICSNNPQTQEEIKPRTQTVKLDSEGNMVFENKKPARRNEDGKLIYYKKGEQIIAQVQNYQKPNKHGRNIFRKDGSEFSESELAQLRSFADVVENAYKERGYYPDLPYVLAESSNVYFNTANKLVLVDTNHIRHNPENNEGIAIASAIHDFVKKRE